MYKVVEYFRDLKDNGYAYNVGDEFPRQGMTVSDERLKELSSTENKRGIKLIEEVIEKKSVADDFMNEPEESVQPVQDKPKTRRGRKNDVD